MGKFEKKCQANVSSIKLDSFYVLTKGTNGVKAKFIGAPWMGSKKKAIYRSITKAEERIGFLIVGAVNT